MSDLMMRDLTPIGMYQNADPVVQAILILLAVASMASWTVLFAKVIELALQRRGLRRALTHLRAARNLEGLDGLRGSAARLLAEAEREIEASGAALPVAGVKERLALRLSRIEASEGRRAGRGTGVLATIGAVAPFVGLFGTVWGIMNSFVSIAQNQSTNLAIVAPGIAEALLATAVGLGAAIPAVVIYNALGRVIAAQRAGLADAAALVLAIAGRDLDRATGRP